MKFERSISHCNMMVSLKQREHGNHALWYRFGNLSINRSIHDHYRRLCRPVPKTSTIPNAKLLRAGPLHASHTTTSSSPICFVTLHIRGRLRS